MTVTTTTIKSIHNAGNNVSTFPYQYRILQATDLEVLIRSSSGAESLQVLNSNYTVTGVNNPTGGTVVFAGDSIPIDGQKVVIRRNVPQTQVIDYIANDPFPAETHEEGLDRNTMVIQQVSEATDRSIKLSRTNSMTSTEFTVGAADRANKVLSFDTDGELSIAQELGTFRGNWSAGVLYNVRDLVKDTTNNNIFLVNTQHESSGVLPLDTNVNASMLS